MDLTRRTTLVMRAAASVLSLLAAACTATDPSIDAPDLGGYDAGAVFADTVIAYGTADNIVTCSETLPVCGEATTPCGPVETLGAPDTNAYILPAQGRLEVGFVCGQIAEKGGSGDEISYEFQVLATVPDGARANVEVSLDGTSFETVRELTQDDQLFDLTYSTTTLQLVRFIRITDLGGGGISIDAISAL